jgi:hypothetical protein
MHGRFVVSLLIFVAVVLLASQPMFRAWADLPVLSVDKVAAEVGGTVLLNVTLSNVPSCGGWELALVWDPHVVRLTTGGPDSVEPAAGGPPVVLIEGSFLSDVAPTYFIVNSANNQIGRAVVGDVFVSEGSSASGTGIILMMNFTAIRAGTTTIEMRPPFPAVNESAVVDASNRYVNHVEINGLITVQARAGDINGDGIVDRNDAAVLAYAFGSRPSDPNWNANADLNGDNVVDILDAIDLANHFLQHYP